MQKVDLTQEQKMSELIRRDSTDVSDVVRDVISNVRERGDAALCEYTAKFDGVDARTPHVMMRNELETYCSTIMGSLTSAQREAIETAVANVSWVASKSMPKSWRDTAPAGHTVGEEFTAFDRVACYVPQGSFPLVSTAIHTAAIANACGVQEIVMVTSPSNEDLNPAVAYAALLSGITEIVFVGGAQGIAAVGVGTETIKKVDFICGPGNRYVAEAKRQLFGTIGIDMVAGPSEVFVIADNSADPYAAACDLVAQAEHGSGFEAAVLLSDSDDFISRAEKELENIRGEIKDNPGFERVWDNSLFLAKVTDIDAAIVHTNECAPEHVEVMTVNASADAAHVVNAGAVFVGPYSAEPLGDFVAGPSHVLPTNSSARFSSGLSAASFFRRTSVIDIDRHAYEKLAPLAYEFGIMEGLTGHALSSIARLDKTTQETLREQSNKDA